MMAIHVSDTLRLIHKESILHRDISPGNIMRSHMGIVKLGDLGFSSFYSSTTPDPTPRPDVDTRSDVDTRPDVTPDRLTITESGTTTSPEATPSPAPTTSTQPTAAPAAADFTFVTSGLTATFTNQSHGATTWTWDFGDGSTSTALDPVHVYATGGTYAVTLTVAGVDAVPVTLSVDVTVAP